MLRILIDQDFDHDILRGIVRRLPKLDYATAFESGLSELEDKKLLLWASQNKRILLTHDRRTMPTHFVKLLEQDNNLSGVFIVPRRMPIAQAIDELEIIITCSEQEEWQNLIKILPL
jgi:uncharacterized protein with PIN domain